MIAESKAAARARPPAVTKPPRSDPINLAAQRILQAITSGTPGLPVRDLIGDTDIAAAYAVQQVVNGARVERGAYLVGRKIGLTSAAVQRQIGVEQPDFGVLFNDMRWEDGGVIPASKLLQPRAEAEIAFVLAQDLDDGPFTVEHVAGAVAFAVAALEIVDSRVAGWDVRITDTVADNASSGMFVLGIRHVRLESFVPLEVAMTMTKNGVVVSNGDGKACLGDPLAALAWLADTACTLGEPLQAGEIVLSGALGAMVPVAPGDTVRADITNLGAVTAIFSTEGTK